MAKNYSEAHHKAINKYRNKTYKAYNLVLRNEEDSDLIQAIETAKANKEEIADVRVMLEQIEYLYGVSDDEITLRMCAKLWRQLERMEGKND